MVAAALSRRSTVKMPISNNAPVIMLEVISARPAHEDEPFNFDDRSNQTVSLRLCQRRQDRCRKSVG
jgi:hypothetical protein